MTGRFTRLSLKNFTPEDKATGFAAGAVLAGAVGLSVLNPLAGGSAAAETEAQVVAEKKGAVTSESTTAQA